MKTSPQLQSRLFKVVLLVACIILLFVGTRSKAIGLPNLAATANRVAVNFSHDVVRNELSIRLKSATETFLQLFIFTADGVLVKELSVSAHTTTRVRGLKRGLYLYECFDHDARMKSGSLLIK